MATRRKSSRSKSGGSTLFGILIGLIVGLAAAVAVALFVTKVPMPFMDKASRDPAKVLLPNVRDAPDPNIGLYGKPPAGSMPTTSPAFGAGPTDGTQSGKPDDLGNLIASLGKPEPVAPVPAKPVPTTIAPAANIKVPGTEAPVTPNAVDKATWYLQAGAFRSENDAEAIKARILLMGLPVQVQKAQVNGATLHRVRVGPFKGVDEMNRVRVNLSDEKIESSVVRQ